MKQILRIVYLVTMLSIALVWADHDDDCDNDRFGLPETYIPDSIHTCPLDDRPISLAYRFRSDAVRYNRELTQVSPPSQAKSIELELRIWDIEAPDSCKKVHVDLIVESSLKYLGDTVLVASSKRECKWRVKLDLSPDDFGTIVIKTTVCDEALTTRPHIVSFDQDSAKLLPAERHLLDPAMFDYRLSRGCSERNKRFDPGFVRNGLGKMFRADSLPPEEWMTTGEWYYLRSDLFTGKYEEWSDSILTSYRSGELNREGVLRRIDVRFVVEHPSEYESKRNARLLRLLCEVNGDSLHGKLPCDSARYVSDKYWHYPFPRGGLEGVPASYGHQINDSTCQYKIQVTQDSAASDSSTLGLCIRAWDVVIPQELDSTAISFEVDQVLQYNKDLSWEPMSDSEFVWRLSFDIAEDTIGFVAFDVTFGERKAPMFVAMARIGSDSVKMYPALNKQADVVKDYFKSRGVYVGPWEETYPQLVRDRQGDWHLLGSLSPDEIMTAEDWRSIQLPYWIEKQNRKPLKIDTVIRVTGKAPLQWVPYVEQTNTHPGVDDGIRDTIALEVDVQKLRDSVYRITADVYEWRDVDSLHAMFYLFDWEDRRVQFDSAVEFLSEKMGRSIVVTVPIGRDYITYAQCFGLDAFKDVGKLAPSEGRSLLSRHILLANGWTEQDSIVIDTSGSASTWPGLDFMDDKTFRNDYTRYKPVWPGRVIAFADPSRASRILPGLRFDTSANASVPLNVDSTAQMTAQLNADRGETDSLNVELLWLTPPGMYPAECAANVFLWSDMDTVTCIQTYVGWNVPLMFLDSVLTKLDDRRPDDTRSLSTIPNTQDATLLSYDLLYDTTLIPSHDPQKIATLHFTLLYPPESDTVRVWLLSDTLSFNFKNKALTEYKAAIGKPAYFVVPKGYQLNPAYEP